ncbi:hypothetical protein NKR74_13215 [Bacillus sp. 3103sda1]|uniref:hypothetical protein n=1 Tax=Bacillus sp. 3103sda1 TaxID=2953808 RepID=UPI00209DB418|nr:hypothetical protein [Bacillus sp. 3103sda1]MCP1124260.1 hypothetical protein [Bacillus sp. 3103sda1]
MAVTFYIGNNHKEAQLLNRWIHFEDHIHDLLWKYENGMGTGCELLIDLDPYGDRTFSFEEVNKMINICIYVMNEYAKQPHESTKDLIECKDEIQTFAKELKELCEEALQRKKCLLAIGD